MKISIGFCQYELIILCTKLIVYRWIIQLWVNIFSWIVITMIYLSWWGYLFSLGWKGFQSPEIDLEQTTTYNHKKSNLSYFGHIPLSYALNLSRLRAIALYPFYNTIRLSRYQRTFSMCIRKNKLQPQS